MATMPMAGQGTIFGVGMAAGSPSHPSQARAQRNRELFELQQRARRGPTPEVFFAKHIDNSRIVKADDPERRREMRTFTATMSVLFLLVMVYVWQHFSAIEIGYQVETQKQQVRAAAGAEPATALDRGAVVTPAASTRSPGSWAWTPRSPARWCAPTDPEPMFRCWRRLRRQLSRSTKQSFSAAVVRGARC